MKKEPERVYALTEEHWKTLGLQQRWTLIVLTVQAAATTGTLIAALVGLWTVSPIITYRIEQQERGKRTEQEITLPDTDPVTARFVEDVHAWWQDRIESYQRVLELIGEREDADLNIRYEILEAPQIAGVDESRSDILVLTATDRAGRTRVAKAPINEGAMPLTQYIQYRLNHGAFSELDETKREKVDAAVSQYMRFYMVPGVPPPYIGTNMSPEEIASEIRSCQKLRIDAFKHIQALNAVIEVALVG